MSGLLRLARIPAKKAFLEPFLLAGVTGRQNYTLFSVGRNAFQKSDLGEARRQPKVA
jgi:hypothetical protein